MPKFLKKMAETPAGRFAGHHWLTIAFVFGFVNDFLLLNQVDNVFDNLILLFYVTLAMVSIVLLYSAVAGRWPEVWNERIQTYAAMAVQYAFGGLLSGMLIFYGRSASLGDSWPYLLIIAGIIYLNESVKKRSGRLVLMLSIFFIGLFSYVVLVIPVLTGKMGEWIFIGSGLLALLIMSALFFVLRLVIPRFIASQTRMLVFSIGSIFALMNFLYFFNLIPPIPLSIKDIGIYHSVVRFENGEYQLKYEEGEWWQFWKRSDTEFHPNAGDNVFCFTKVFTPARLNTEVYHRWEYFDEAQKKWVTHARLPYYIFGGRSDGYRGYTQIGSFRDGKWRCSVETDRGQVLGRESFRIDSTASSDSLIIRID